QARHRRLAQQRQRRADPARDPGFARGLAHLGVWRAERDVGLEGGLRVRAGRASALLRERGAERGWAADRDWPVPAPGKERPPVQNRGIPTVAGRLCTTTGVPNSVSVHASIVTISGLTCAVSSLSETHTMAPSGVTLMP